MSEPWIKRAYDPRTDEDGVVYLWLKSYAHAPHNRRRGAHRDGSDAERAYWKEHAPVVGMILRTSTTEVLCDPNRVHQSVDGPPVFFAFACTSPGAVHYVSVKRAYAREGFGADMVRDLLGARLDNVQACSHDLPEMRPDPRTTRAPCGVAMPERWYLDPWWLTRAMMAT